MTPKEDAISKQCNIFSMMNYKDTLLVCALLVAEHLEGSKIRIAERFVLL